MLELHPKPKLSMFQALSQNYQHFFEIMVILKQIIWKKTLKNSIKILVSQTVIDKTCKILFWSQTQQPLGLLNF